MEELLLKTNNENNEKITRNPTQKISKFLKISMINYLCFEVLYVQKSELFSCPKIRV